MKKWLFTCILASELLMVSPLQASIQSDVTGFFEYISKKVHRHVTKNRIAVIVVAGSVAYLLFGKPKLRPYSSFNPFREREQPKEEEPVYPQASAAIARAANAPGNPLSIPNRLPRNIDLNHIAVFDYKGIKLIVVQGIDITNLPVEAIVNAANTQLSHGGGIAQVINAAANNGGCLAEADKQALEKFKKRHDRPFATGDALIVDGCELKKRGIKKIIHAVGPSVNSGNITQENQEQLDSAYLSAFMVANVNKVTSMAIPIISGNLFGYPVGQSMPIALKAIKGAIDLCLKEATNHIKEIWFSIYGNDNNVTPPATQQQKFNIYLEGIPQVFSSSKMDDKKLRDFISQKQSYPF